METPAQSVAEAINVKLCNTIGIGHFSHIIDIGKYRWRPYPVH